MDVTQPLHATAVMAMVTASFAAIALSQLQRRGAAMFVTEVIIVATTVTAVVGLVPEPFDHPPLLTLVVALPIARILLGHRYPWSTAIVLSCVAVLTAFVPGGVVTSAPWIIPDDTGALLHSSLHVVVWVLALNLVALSRCLPIPQIQAGRAAAFGMVVTTIAVAFGAGWISGGVALDQGKLASWQGVDIQTMVVVVMALAAHAIVVATIEESFFRGIVIPAMITMLGSRFRMSGAQSVLVALATSSLLFGLAHFHLGWIWVLCSAIAGIGYGVAYLFLGGLASSILSHSMVVLVLTAFFGW